VSSNGVYDRDSKGGPFVHEAQKRTAVLLDRHPLWHEAVERVLDRLEVTIVCKTTSPAAALQAVEASGPNVFITGLKMKTGEIDGLQCIREALDRVPQLQCIVLSMYSDAGNMEAALEAGAFAYVMKSAHPDHLSSVIEQAFERSIATTAANNHPRRRTASEPSVPDLTPREREILQLLAEGHTNAQLAKLLWVTDQTVKFHLSNIYRKLSVSNRTEASHWAQLRGLLESPIQP
jgi:DNA-binding NarL/FixJ family response regulator